MEKESFALVELAELSKQNIAVSFSGGKDSLVVLDLAQRVGIRKAVFVDTTVEFDETVDYIRSVEDFYGFKINVLRAPVDFFGMVGHVGVPSRRFRWCCDVFKFGPLARYAFEQRLDGFITGLRKEESHRRLNYKSMDKNPLVPVAQINPIINWSSGEVWEYISANSLPANPLYEHFGRIGCWCCPYRTDQESRQIEELFPEKAKQFETVLLDFAQRMKIKDTDMFIKGRGWTRWSSPLKKHSIGSYSPCQNGDRNQVDLVFSGESPQQIKRIVKILPILTKDFFAVGNKLRVTVKDDDKKRLNVLVEKAINCKGCGACLSLCKVGALHLDEESIYVDKNECTQCQRCLVSSSSNLRGACVIRNYSPKRVSLAGSMLPS